MEAQHQDGSAQHESGRGSRGNGLPQLQDGQEVDDAPNGMVGMDQTEMQEQGRVQEEYAL